MISANLGRSSKSFTATFYGDIAHEVKRDASQKIAAAFALTDGDLSSQSLVWLAYGPTQATLRSRFFGQWDVPCRAWICR